MSMPDVPDISPKVNLRREDVINLLLSSIALEEIGLSHIINAEGEKIQDAIKKARDIKDLLDTNESVEHLLRTILTKEFVLETKLRDVMKIDNKKKCCDD